MDVAFMVLPSDDFQQKALKRQNFIDSFTLESSSLCSLTRDPKSAVPCRGRWQSVRLSLLRCMAGRLFLFPHGRERAAAAALVRRPSLALSLGEDGGAAAAAGGGDPRRPRGSAGQLHQSGEGRRVLREQLCPGERSRLRLATPGRDGLGGGAA